MYFRGNAFYQFFLVFALMLNLLTLDSNSKNTNWISIGVSSKQNKPIDINLSPTRTNLANGRVTIKFNNSVLVQTNSFSLYSTCILNLYIVYELNGWLRNLRNKFVQKKLLVWQSQINKKFRQKQIYLKWSRNSIWWK